MKTIVTYHDTLNAVRTTLQQMAQWGCRGFQCSEERLATLRQWVKEEILEQSGPETLEQVRQDLGECRRCSLAEGRHHIVFGEGNPDADLVFVGEGPGHDEDLAGRPFVGPAGQLLEKIIQAMNLTRDQVYICNIVKCRPPENRVPAPDETEACRPYLKRQLGIINPQVVCTLGAAASKMLLNSPQSISKLRGRFHDLGDIKVMPTFHPAYLLRNPDQKRAVWQDMKKIMALLRIPQ